MLHQMRTVKVLYPNVLDVGCFSHTITMQVAKARLQWKDRTGHSMRAFSETRATLCVHLARLAGGVYKWKVLDQLLVMCGDVKGFLEDNPDVGQATRTKLLAILNDPVKASLLHVQIELAAFIDVGSLRRGSCYEQICTVINSIRAAHKPNIRAIAEPISGPAVD
jgi:hypothetical protein